MKKLGLHLKNNAYIYCLGFASAFLIFYCIYFLNDEIYSALCKYDKLFSWLSTVATLCFTTGIFTVSLKYLTFLNVFQDEFNKAIGSSAFDKKLKNHLKQVTFSRKFLRDQSNLPAIWEKVTLVMYQREFPHIYEKVKKKITNSWFDKSSISYYYKNFQINYQISLKENKYIVIEEYVTYTIVRPNTEKFNWDFGYEFDETEDTNVGIEIEGTIYTCDNRKITTNDIQNTTNDGKVLKKVAMELEGHLEYHITRKNVICSHLDTDREHSFSSSRIIDDLTINISYGNDLDVIFAPVNRQKFYKNDAFPDYQHAYINRDIFLDGEKFKLFFIRRQ